VRARIEPARGGQEYPRDGRKRQQAQNEIGRQGGEGDQVFPGDAHVDHGSTFPWLDFLWLWLPVARPSRGSALPWVGLPVAPPSLGGGRVGAHSFDDCVIRPANRAGRRKSSPPGRIAFRQPAASPLRKSGQGNYSAGALSGA